MSTEELSDAQIEELHARMLAQVQELTALLSNENDGGEIVDLDQPIGRLSRMDALQQQQMVHAQRRRHELRLKQLHVALKTWEEGEYGWCKKCGEPVGYQRLKARPESPCCVPCMQEIGG